MVITKSTETGPGGGKQVQSSQSMHSNQQLKVIQINLGRGLQASTDLLRFAEEENNAILLIQEPRVVNRQICGLSKYKNTIITGSKTHEVPWTCIVILDDRYTATVLTDISTAHCVCAHITGPTNSFYVVSLYCQFSDPIGPYLDQLRVVLRTIGRTNILIGANVNAVSPVWSPIRTETTDRRGTEVETLIAEYDLVVLNKPGNACTFRRGTRDIDITLASPALSNHVISWKVCGEDYEHWVESDHRPIMMELGYVELEPERLMLPRFNVRHAKWKSFKQVIRSGKCYLKERTINSPEEVEILATDLQNLIIKAAKKSCRKKKARRKMVPWWTDHLSEIKRRTYAARRRYQQEQNLQRRLEMKTAYLCICRNYKHTAKTTRLRSWRKFVADSSKENPFGLPYRICNDKCSPKTTMSNIRHATGYTRTWEESAQALLDGLFTNSNELTTVSTASLAYEAPLASLWTPEEVKNAIWSMKNGKAPGNDLIEVEMVKNAVKAGLLGELVKLYNACLTHGINPRIWKKGVIRMLLKSMEKDPTDCKSYRPICLLSALSKPLDKLIRNSVRHIVRHPSYSSRKQYGFREGCSTEDAIAHLRENIKNSTGKQVLALLFDITGAFDHLRWSAILEELRKRGCPSNLYELVRDYLNNRSVAIVDNYGEVAKNVNQGCPQGSVLGPDFWNIVLDDLLLIVENAGGDVIAYADDFIILVHGSSRRDLERKAQELRDIVTNWCRLKGLTLSKSKTEQIMLKDGGRIAKAGKQITSKGEKRKQVAGSLGGSLKTDNKGGVRPPSVRIEGVGMKYSHTVKYLGVKFGQRLTITQHIEEVCAKTKTIFNKLGNMAKKDWGINYGALRMLYGAVFIPIITYAAGAWGDLILKHHERKMGSAQRIALIRVTKAYFRGSKIY